MDIRTRLRRSLRATLAALATLIAGLSACARHPQATEPPAVPVYSVVVAAAGENEARAFAAEVRPHHEAPVGFRVPGKLVTRIVELGTVVHKGDLLAQLDPNDLALEAGNLASRLAEARRADEFLGRELARYRDLHEHNLISDAELDRHESDSREAHERALALAAQLEVARNAAGYANLRADRDGLISALLADPGQVLSAGQPVVAIADSSDREVDFDVPETLVADVHPGAVVRIALWGTSRPILKAKVRDLAQAADRATRTFRVKASLPGDAPVKLGMSATAYLELPADGAVRVPSPALVQPSTPQPHGAEVWVIDASHHVHPVPVELLEFLPDEQAAVRGVAPSSRIVTAGLRRLTSGQPVVLLDIPPGDPTASAAAVDDAEARLAKLP